VPIYKQIVGHFEEEINNKDFLPFSKLPSERELAKRYGVNRSTITTAYGELFASNLVTTKKGRGTLVGKGLD
jgi:GntR family transcriptional regulator, regulator for abcA and norABC